MKNLSEVKYIIPKDYDSGFQILPHGTALRCVNDSFGGINGG